MAENPWKKFEKDVIKEIEKGLKELDCSIENLSETIEEPPQSEFGDLATTVCFELPEKLKDSPKNIAEKLSQKVSASGLIEEIDTREGYVNFFLDEEKFAKIVLDSIIKKGENYGKGQEKDEKVIIEHTSVNPTKPLHVGHGRNAIIGDTVSRILNWQGFDVEVQNYIDDLGLQVSQTLVPYLSRKNKEIDKKFDHFLGKLYVDFHEEKESNPELEDKAREYLTEMEEGKSEIADEARNMAEKCVESNLATSDRLNIDYDLLVWESNIANSGMLDETLERLKQTSYLVEGTGDKEGALVLELEEFGVENKVMVRSDGTAVYTAKDLAYQLWKFGEVNADLDYEFHSERFDGSETYTTDSEGKVEIDFGEADKVINVIGVEQKYPQNVIFTALKTLGLEEEYKNSHHLAYEHVSLPSEKFKGREGTWIGYSVDDVLNETVERAKEEVIKRNPEANENFINEAAEKVGIGAFRFSLINSSPEKEVVFEWDEALDFSRNSGPAIQYSHARACSILRKVELEDSNSYATFKKPQEIKLVKKLAKFPEILKTASERFRPHLLANYAADLSLKFNKFYEVAPVLDAENEDLKNSRVRLVECSRLVLKKALELLGIEAPEKM